MKKKRDYKREYQRRKYKRQVLDRKYRQRVIMYVHKIERLYDIDNPDPEHFSDDEFFELMDDERADLMEELKEASGIDFDDWLDIMTEYGYSEHEAYELWYYA